jgi:hypothetical protein
MNVAGDVFDTTIGNEIDNETAWTTKLAASGDSKIELSPALANFVIPPSEKAIIGGNDNTTVEGLPYLVGDNNIEVTFEIHSPSQAVINLMDELSCLSDATLGKSNLTVFMMSRFIRGKSFVIGKAGSGADTYVGIPVYNFHISTLGNEGYNSKNKYMGSFTVRPSDMRAIASAPVEFDPFSLANVTDPA